VKRFAAVAAVSIIALVGCGKQSTDPRVEPVISAAPSLCSPSNWSGNQSISLDLAWDTVPGATSYEVQASTSATFAATVFSRLGIAGNAQQITGLDSGVLYFWRVNAANTSGPGPWSDAWNFTTIAVWGAPPLAAPANGSLNQAVSPHLAWAGTNGAQWYTVQVSTDAGFSTQVFGQSGITPTSEVVGGLQNLTTYYWRVNAFNGVMSSGWSGAWSFTTILSAPRDSLPANGSPNQLVYLDLSWSGVRGALTYSMQVSTDTGFSTLAFARTGLASTSQAVSGLADLTTYYWRVNAGDSGATGAWSGVWSFTTTKLTIPQDSIQLNPTGVAPLCAIVKFTSPIACRTEIVVHGKTVGANLSHQFSDSGLYHAVTVLGLYANYANTVDLWCILPNDSVAARGTVTITTPALPANMPTKIVTTTLDTGNVAEGWNLVSNWSCSDPQIPYFVDDYGDIRWLLNYTGTSALSGLSYDCGLERLRNGDYFFGDLTSQKIYEVGITGTIVNTWPLPSGYLFHHNVIEKPDGNFIMTVSKTGSTNANGVGTIEDHVIEVNRTTGALVNDWDLNVSLNDTRTVLSTDAQDWFHGNGVVYDSSDNTIILSGRVQGVVKLTYANQVEWILGPHRGWGKSGNGVNLNTLLLTPLDSTGSPITDTSVVEGWTNDSSFEWNWYQHSPFLMPNGDLLLFDNGSSRNFDSTTPARYSRAVEYKIDPAAMTVRQIWTYGKARGYAAYANLFGRVEYLPQNNHILFCPGFGVANATAGGYGGKIIEVDYATRTVVLETEISALNEISHHRAERMDLYPPAVASSGTVLSVGKSLGIYP